MSTLPDPTAPAVRRRTTHCTPLLDLIRTALAERGSVTFRAMPDRLAGVAADDPLALSPHNETLYLADDQDDVRLLSSLVYGLHFLGLGDADPRLEKSVRLFVSDAAARTVAAMGEVAR